MPSAGISATAFSAAARSRCIQLQYKKRKCYGAFGLGTLLRDQVQLLSQRCHVTGFAKEIEAERKRAKGLFGRMFSAISKKCRASEQRRVPENVEAASISTRKLRGSNSTARLKLIFRFLQPGSSAVNGSYGYVDAELR